jgi:methionyl-tRNA formyltransferase
MGTPNFAVPTLSDILAAGHDVVGVYTQPPRAAGRGMQARRSPVHVFAEQQGLPVSTPMSLKSEDEQAAFAALRADVAVVVAYGLILPAPVLEAPAYGCLNLHGSALPRWRGAAPIQRAIMAGDSETAATVMRMDEGLDTGSVCLAEPIAIDAGMTAGDLHDRMAILGGDLMVRALAALQRGSLTCAPQPDDGVTYAKKIDKAESRIDFRQPAQNVHNLIRGLSPMPGAWFELTLGKRTERVKVLRTTVSAQGGVAGTLLDDELLVACGSGSVRLIEVQRAGKTPMSAQEFLRGRPLRSGDRI